jgi:hypothetical protein
LAFDLEILVHQWGDLFRHNENRVGKVLLECQALA